jgi:hypothetical protein
MKGLMRLGILVAAVVLTAGCGGGSGDDPGSTEPGSVTPGPGPTPGPVESTTPIAFSAQQQDEQDVTRAGEAVEGGTRAAGLQTLLPADDKTFKVWGYKTMSDGTTLQTVFPGYTVNYVSAAHSTTTNSDGWEYVGLDGASEQTIKYWDWSVDAYRFFGVTGGLSGDSGHYGDGDQYETYKIVIPADATNVASTPYYSHLWYSTGVLPEYSSRQFGQPVQLEFVQPISRVRFMYKYVTPREGVSLADQSFRPTDDSEKIIISGTVTVTYPLTGTETREWFTTTSDGIRYDFHEDYDPDDRDKVYTDSDNGWYIVLPNAAQGSYTLKVEINGIEKSATVPAEFMHWQPGYSYTYVFKINAEGGVEIGWVEYAVTTPWKTGESGTWTVYNW